MLPYVGNIAQQFRSWQALQVNLLDWFPYELSGSQSFTTCLGYVSLNRVNVFREGKIGFKD